MIGEIFQIDNFFFRLQDIHKKKKNLNTLLFLTQSWRIILSLLRIGEELAQGKQHLIGSRSTQYYHLFYFLLCVNKFIQVYLTIELERI